jgi:hypothetical protein
MPFFEITQLHAQNNFFKIKSLDPHLLFNTKVTHSSFFFNAQQRNIAFHHHNHAINKSTHFSLCLYIQTFYQKYSNKTKNTQQ